MTWKAIIWGAVEAFRLSLEQRPVEQYLKADENFNKLLNAYLASVRVGVSDGRNAELVFELKKSKLARNILRARAFPNQEGNADST